MNRSDTIGALATALAKAQKALKPAVKDVTNTFYKSSYADLEAVTEACRDALADNDLAYSQMTDFDADKTWVETILIHGKSGEWLAGRYPVRPTKDDPQGLGSAVTYAKRYGLMGAVGIVATAEDDDGNAASGHSSAPAPAKKPPASKPEPAAPASIELSTDAKRGLAMEALHKGLDEVRQIKTLDSLKAWQKLNSTMMERAKPYDSLTHGDIVALIAQKEKTLT